MWAKLQSAIALFTSSCLVCVASAPSNIGLLVTSGEAHVDGSAIRGNSTLFPGSLVQAGNATSDLMFSGGSNLLLQPDAAVKVFRGYAVLENGSVVQHGNQALIAGGLRISSLSSQGSVVVGMQDATHLRVTAQNGPAEVRNTAGAMVARLEPGKAFSFSIQETQQAPPAPQQNPTPVFGIGSQSQQITIHGVLRKDHAGRYGHYLVTDTLSKATYELQGPGLDDLVGALVEATGTLYDTAPAEGASRVLSVSDVHQYSSNELPSTPETAPPTEAAGQPAPPDTAPAPSTSTAAPEAPSTTAPEAPAAPEEASVPQPPPLVVHSDTAKILVIVGIAAGAAVGVALGLAGGKSSTVSPE